MANNNTVKLIGNIGSEARIIETEDRTFASFSIATTDSYKDQDGNWQEKDTIWHDVVAFSPKLVQALKAFKKGTRLEVTGALSYRDFQVDDNGKVITKKEASIVAYKVEQAPLTKKS
jgi:single-strand DNA-binding protein